MKHILLLVILQFFLIGVAHGDRKGMTWGFAGLSDIWAPSGGALSQACETKLYHANYVRLACETFPVDSPKSNYCGMDFSIYQPNATSHILRPPPDPQNTSHYVKKCDPSQGDTPCDEERHVLCIADKTNPYYNHQPPYADSSAGLADFWPGSSPPYNRPRYKINTPSTGRTGDANGWVDQPVKLSRYKVKGTKLTSAAKGDEECGVGWHMASSDDGKWVRGMGVNTAYGNAWPSASPKRSGDLAFHAWLAPDANIGWGHPGDTGLNARKNFFFDRYWVKSTHGGNCWDDLPPIFVDYANKTDKLNDTGITKCGDYAAQTHDNDLGCPADAITAGTDTQGDPKPPGQDAVYGRDETHNDSSDGHAGFEFIKIAANGSLLPANATTWSCVKDNVTGMVWEVKTDDGGLHDKDWTYTWYEPNASFNGGQSGTQNGGNCGSNGSCDTKAYVAATNANGLCGANDWRMATKDELQSIVNYGRYNPTIDTNYFPNTISTHYLTSSPYAGNNAQIWVIDFSHGKGPSSNKSTARRARLVRGN